MEKVASKELNKIAFISGHTDLTLDEFQKYYVPRIQEALAQDHSFVLGSAPGADTLALHFLAKYGVPAKITVYLFERNPENRTRSEAFCQLHNILMITGFSSYTSRDAEMTRVTDYDIAWVRPIEESMKMYGDKFNAKRVSGTQKNLDRRAKLNVQRTK